MPKPYTFPTLYNEVLQINISNLKEWDYLKPKQVKSGTLTWSRGGTETASISIKVDTQSERPYIELNYKQGDQPRIYKIMLVTLPSNLGKGHIWYFLCPHTNKRCRKLYLIGGYFLHREAFKGCLYETQTKSKNSRRIDKEIKTLFLLDEIVECLNQKHFKKTYKGKPTKRYLRLLDKINKVNDTIYHELIL